MVTIQTAIAQPTEVPFEMVAGAYQFGMVAKHIEGIASVEHRFSDGVTPDLVVTTTERGSLTKHTNAIWCHQGSVELGSLNDGQVTVTQTATPNGAGQTPRVMTWSLFNNSAGSFTPLERWVSPGGSDSNPGTEAQPFATIHAAIRSLASADPESDPGGHTVYLTAGTHQNLSRALPYPVSARSWVNVMPAPGLTKPQVVIRSGDARWRNVKHVHLKDLRIETTSQNADQNVSGDAHIWFDGCDIIGPGRSVSGGPWTQGWDYVYHTDGDISEAGTTLVSFHFARDCTLHAIGEDIIKECSGALFNITCHDQTLSVPLGHPDGLQFTSDTENVVVQGLRVYNAQSIQALFWNKNTPSRSYRDMSIENVSLQVEDLTSNLESQLAGDHRHVLFDHITLTGAQKLMLRVDEGYTANGCRLANCSFYGTVASGGSGPVDEEDELRVQTIHHEIASDSPSVFGSLAGDPLYSDVSGYDLRPGTGSPLIGAGTVLDNGPPGPKGVGDPANPNLGAWGDAAGAGFDAEPYVGYHPLVTANLSYLETNMTWEGVAIFAKRKAWAPEATSVLAEDEQFRWEQACHTLADGRSIRLTIRYDVTAATGYIDFWARIYHGHTGTSKVKWTADQAGETWSAGLDKIKFPAVKIQGSDAVTLGVGQVHITKYMGHGQAPVDSSRITFTDVGVWSSGDVENSTTHRANPVFGRSPTVPSGFAINIDNAFDAEKAAELGDWNSQGGFGQFTRHAPPDLGDSGYQPFLGKDQSALDYAANRGNERELTLRRLVCNNAFRPGHHVHPDDDLTHWKSDDTPLLQMHWSDGFFIQSRGYNPTPGVGQNWFSPPVGRQPDATEWMSKPSFGSKYWNNTQQEHAQLGVLIAAQLDRHRDAGVYWEAIHQWESYASTFPAEDRGPSPISPIRAWGRVASTKVALFSVLGGEARLQHLRDWAEFGYNYWDGIGRQPKLRDRGNEVGGYGCWETAIQSGGWYHMLALPDLSPALRAKIEDLAYELGVWTLIGFHKWNTAQGRWDSVNGDRWRMPYLVNLDGSPHAFHSQPSALVEWAIQGVQVLKFLFMGRLSASDQTKVTEILDEFDQETRDPNTWPRVLDFLVPNPEGFVQPVSPAAVATPQRGTLTVTPGGGGGTTVSLVQPVTVTATATPITGTLTTVETQGLDLTQPASIAAVADAQKGTLSVTPGSGTATVEMVQPSTVGSTATPIAGVLRASTGRAVRVAEITGTGKVLHEITGRAGHPLRTTRGVEPMLSLGLRHYITGSLKDGAIMQENQHIRYVRGADGDIAMTALDLDVDTLDGSETWRWVVRKNPTTPILVDYLSGTSRITIDGNNKLPTISIDPADFNDLAKFPNEAGDGVLEQTYQHELWVTKDERSYPTSRGEFVVVTPIVHDLAVS